MLGIIGCLAAFLLVMYLCYKNWSIFIAALTGAVVCILFNGLPVLKTLNEIYLVKLAGFVQGYFFIFLFGAIQAKIYIESGAALSIADTIMKISLKNNVSQTRKQILAILMITLMGTILSYGGILTTIVVILLYPVALVIFEKADIPKKFILGVLANGCFTFGLTAPGTPEVTNIVCMNFLGTSSACALVPGLAGTAIEILVVVFVLNKMINRARGRGEHFEFHELDKKYDSSKDKPKFMISVIPLMILFIMFNFLKIDIVYCLAASVIISVILFLRYMEIKNVQDIVNSGAVSALAPVCTVSAVIGFAGVVSSTEAFQTIVSAILALNLPPIVLLVVCTALLCALTGGSATGLTICLPIIGVQMVDNFGLAPEVVHRVSVFAATTMDTLPYSGAILMFLPISHMKLKEVYPATFVTTVLATIAGTITVAFLCAVFPGLA